MTIDERRKFTRRLKDYILMRQERGEFQYCIGCELGITRTLINKIMNVDKYIYERTGVPSDIFRTAALQSEKKLFVIARENGIDRNMLSFLINGLKEEQIIKICEKLGISVNDNFI